MAIGALGLSNGKKGMRGDKKIPPWECYSKRGISSYFMAQKNKCGEDFFTNRFLQNANAGDVHLRQYAK